MTKAELDENLKELERPAASPSSQVATGMISMISMTQRDLS